MKKVETLSFMTVEEIAQMLRVPKSTVYKWVYMKKVPYLKVGKRLLFERHKVLQWIEEHTKK